MRMQQPEQRTREWKGPRMLMFGIYNKKSPGSMVNAVHRLDCVHVYPRHEGRTRNRHVPVVERDDSVSTGGVGTVHQDTGVSCRPCTGVLYKQSVRMNTIAAGGLVGWTDYRHLNFVCHLQSHAVSHTILAVLVDASSR